VTARGRRPVVYRPITHGTFTAGLVTPEQPTPEQLTARWLDIRRLTQRARVVITGHEATMHRDDGRYVTCWHITYRAQTPKYDRRCQVKAGPAR